MIKRGRTFYSRRGFTIVELLIVVVVIAILAAITVVAFTGIQNRAKESASSNETAQVAKKLATYYSVNGELYPGALTDPALSLSDANLVPSPYEYTVSSDQKEFCVTVTKSGVSFFASSSQITPKRGSCAGHVLDGTQTIVNRFMNPQFDGPGAPVNQTGVTTAIASFNSSQMARATTTSAAAVSMRLQPLANRWSIGPGQQTYASVLACNGAASARSLSATIRFYDTNSTTALGTQLSTVASTSEVVPAGGCVTLTMSGVAPASTQSAGVNVNRDTATTPAVGDVYYADNVFFSAQPAAFADGSTPGWFWQGEANNSISYGIPL